MTGLCQSASHASWDEKAALGACGKPQLSEGQHQASLACCGGALGFDLVMSSVS